MLVLNGTTGVSKVQDDTVNALTDIVTSGGIGYKTGDGVSITQLTDKTTAVSINTICGKITTSSVSLSAGVSAYFLVNNSKVISSDCVITNLSSGGTVGDLSAYEVKAVWISNGAFYIAVKNISGVSKSEAIVINFAVIKAVGA